MSWQDTEDPDIRELNEKHFVAQEGGKTRVYNEKYDRVLKRQYVTTSGFEDFRNLYYNQYVEVEVRGAGGRPEIKFEKLGNYWLSHRDRRQYDEIVFEPGAKEEHGVHNLWKGFDVKESAEGSWELLQKHIFDNICCGDEANYNYYIDWMANAVQFPGEQGNVAIVLKGARGTGKGTAIGYFAELFGQHYVHVVSSKQVTGNFNLHLRDAVVLFSDEAVYAGNKAEESVLKGIITERYIAIEGKGRDLIMAKNNLHVMMATNNAWAVPAGEDERRFFVLNVKDDPAVKQNTGYFNAIKKQMMSGGRERMLYDLINRDISKFDSYKAPKTVGLLEQKIESLDDLQAWWYGKLVSGYIFDGIDWETPMPSEAVYMDYVNISKNSGSRYRHNQVSFGKFMREMQDAGWPRLSRRRPESYWLDNKLLLTDKVDKKHYIMDKLLNCRKIFEKKVGHEIVWPEETVEAPSALVVDSELPI